MSVATDVTMAIARARVNVQRGIEASTNVEASLLAWHFTSLRCQSYDMHIASAGDTPSPFAICRSAKFCRVCVWRGVFRIFATVFAMLAVEGLNEGSPCPRRP